MVSRAHTGGNESLSSEAYLAQLRTDNPDMVFIDGLADVVGIAENALERAYGPDSATPLAYHNRLHSRDVGRRGLRLLRIHHAVQPELFDTTRDPSLIVATGELHDLVQLRGPVVNERLSAEFARDMLPHYGFTYREAQTGYDMIMSSVTQHVDGKLQQTMLEHTTSRDPRCLILATADINGIAMEGLGRMVRDSVALTAERHGYDTARVLREKPHDVAAMLGAQAAFFGHRLDQVGHDLRLFYDEATATEIERRYKAEFGSLGSEAIRAATLLARAPLQLHESMTTSPEQLAARIREYLSPGA